MILFLYGEDSYRSRQKLNQIKEKFKATDKGRINLSIIDGEKTPFKNIEKEIVSPPFLHDKKLIVIENFLKAKGTKQHEEMVRFLKESKTQDNVFVVFFEEGQPDMRTAAFKILNQPKQAEKFEPLSLPKLTQWILKEAEAEGVKMETAAVDLLTNLVGSNLWQVASELDKLSAYCKKRDEKQNIISAKDVLLLTHGKFEENIFSLTDAIGNKNKRMTFKILDEQISAGLKESYIFSMLVRQFRILLQIKEIVTKEFSFLSSNDYNAKQRIADTLKLHPYVATKTLTQIKNYELAELKNIYQKLLAMEMQMKRTSLSPRLLLDMFLAEVVC